MIRDNQKTEFSVIEKIMERMKHLTHDNPMVTDKYILREDAIQIVQEVARNGGWIPCSERLPQEEKKVIVWYEGRGWNEEKISDYAIARYRKDYGDWSGTFQGEPTAIIAWQPLPAPFKKGE